MPCSWAGVFLGKEGGIQVLAGLAPSSQTLGSLLRTPWPAKLTRKMMVLNYFLKTYKCIFNLKIWLIWRPLYESGWYFDLYDGTKLFFKILQMYIFHLKILLTFSYTCKHTLLVGKPCSLAGVILGNEGGMQVLAGLAPSTQTVGSLLRTPWPAKLTRKMIVLNYF